MKPMPTLWTYIKNYKFNSIFIKNFLVVLFLLMVPLVVVHYSVFVFNSTSMREEVTRANISELTRIRDTVDIIVKEAENLSVRLGSDPDIQLFFTGEPIRYPLDYPIISRIQRIQNLLRISVLTNPYLGSLQIYSGRDDYLLTESDGGTLDKYQDRWWYDEYVAKKDQSNFWISTMRLPGTERQYAFVLFRQLPTSGAEKDGLMTVWIGTDELAPMLKEVTPEQEIYIIDRNGDILFTRDQERIHTPIREHLPEWPFDSLHRTESAIIRNAGMEYSLSTVPSSNGQWTYVSAVPLAGYALRQERLQSFIIFLVMFGVVSSFVIAFLISVKTYQPIQAILSMLESGHPSIRDYKSTRPAALNEMKYIAATIMQSREKKKEMEAELERRYEMMSKAQAIALQAQINPHMLYNTLEAINWKVMKLTNGKNEASNMIHSLSKLLRLSLSGGDNVIPLRKELEHARLYVEVEQLHYKDELEVLWKVNESILDYLTVKLTLQPIIENAIHHGIRPSGRKGMVSIIGYEDTQSVVLKIKDNGVGISPVLEDKINQSFQSEEIKENENIGLSNVNQRIRLIFGEEYGLRLNGKEGEGLIVEMRLPKLRKF